MMLKKINTLLKEKDICVLSTVSGNSNPHCSLMAYVTDKECHKIYMLTSRATKKFINLKQNPNVSLLIDSRGRPLQDAQALTVRGLFEPMYNKDKRAAAEAILLEKHPHLKDFMDDPETEAICIKVQSYLLLNGLTDSHYISLEEG